MLARGRTLGREGIIVEWAFTDRTRGSSQPPFDQANLAMHVGDDPIAVGSNRVDLAAALAVPVESLVTMTQVHGRGVAVIDSPPNPGSPAAEVDALVTRCRDLALVTQVADCVPVLLASPDGQIAAVHAGWRGVVAGVVDAAVEAMCQRGARASSIDAWIGPAICPACYEVGDDVRAQVTAVTPSAYAVTASGTPSVDVRAGVCQQLARYGIEASMIDGCTAEDDRLFSYRQEGRTGRQAGVIIMREARR